MPYARPTLTQLRNQAQQDISSSGLPGVDGFLQMAVLRVLAWVQAGLAFLHYAYLDWISKQSVPFTSSDEYLAGWGALKGVIQKQPTPSKLTVTMTGTANTDIPNATSFTRSDGALFLSTADAPIGSNGTSMVPVIAVLPGSAGNSAAGAQISLTDGIPGVNSSGIVLAQVTPGTDLEDPTAYQTRVLQIYAAPPQGGDRADYIAWALATPGVTRAWVNPNGFGTGTVIVYTMFDTAESVHGGFPQGTGGTATGETRDVNATGDQLTVANSIYPKQPVTALVYSEAPINTPVNFTVAQLGVNNTALNQAAITAALQAMFLQFANVGGTIQPASGQPWPAVEPSDWYGALEAIPGLTSFDVTQPAAPITPTGGQLFTLGIVTFQT